MALKFKLGDKVKPNKGEWCFDPEFVSEESIGTIVDCGSRNNGNEWYLVDFNGHKQFAREHNLMSLDNNGNSIHEFRVTTNGFDTVKVYYNGRTGVAKCSPEDEFSLGYGFELAVSRAMNTDCINIGDDFWYVSTRGRVCHSTYDGGELHRRMREIGNMFFNEYDAVKAASKILKVFEEYKKGQ